MAVGNSGDSGNDYAGGGMVVVSRDQDGIDRGRHWYTGDGCCSGGGQVDGGSGVYLLRFHYIP